jgi:monoterpene epsilon-lactone hydrolase
MSAYKDPEIGMVRALLAAMPDAPANGALTFAERRPGMDAFGDTAPLPEGHVWEAAEIAGRPAEWHTPPGADATKIILYLHGGGYCIGSPRSHRGLSAQLAHAAGARAVALDYRMGPEVPFPGAVEDALAAYRALLDQGFAPGRIVIAGDSAGGGLTLATALAAREADLPQPAGLFVISPWANLKPTGPSYPAKAASDPMITAAALDDFAAAYLGGVEVTHPLASPALADFTGLAPILIHVGAEESLLSDSIAVAERAGLAGTQVTLEVWPEMIHVWHAFYGALAAGRRAIAGAGAWIAGRFD